jgi:hypothetical protein
VTQRTRRTFWALVLVAIVATGPLSRAVGGGEGTGVALTVAGSALVVATSGSLALRILITVGREEGMHGGPAVDRDAAPDSTSEPAARSEL